MSRDIQKTQKKYDVVIVGAGPSGMTLGYLLSDAGFDVLVIDRTNFPRLKLCAGAITWKTRKLVEDIFKVSFDRYFSIKNVSYEYSVYEKWRLKILQKSPEPFYFIDRKEYDSKLSELAEKKSCSFFFGHQVADIDLTSNTVLTRSGISFQGEIVVGADGSVSTIRRRLFPQYAFRFNLAQAFQASIALNKVKREYQGPIPKLFLGLLNTGYGWLYPHQDQCVLGVAGLLRRNSRVEQVYRDFLLRTTTLGHEDIYPLRSHWLPFGNFMECPGNGKVLLVGDAGGFVDPFTGEGIYYAHKTAQLAFRAISEYFKTPGKTEVVQAYKNYLQPVITELRIAQRVRNLAYSPLRHIGYSFFKNPRVYNGLAKTVHGIRDYTQFPLLSRWI
jgi:geranylgeranyl reductase family protein